MSEDITYVINSRRAWGKGSHETEALRRMVEHFHGDFRDQEEIHLFAVRGYEGFEGMQVQGDEVVKSERLHVDGDKLEEMDDAFRNLEIAAEEAITEAEEVEE